MDDQYEQGKTLGDYLGILKRRKWQLILPTALFSVVAVLAALLIPATYRSSATILIERQEIPSYLVRTTVTSFADQRIQVISQRVMTTRNLSEIIERYNLYADLRSRLTINAAVEAMRKAISLKMISADVVDPSSGRSQRATIAFSLSYENESPVLAQKVTNELVSLFLNENIEQRQAAVEEATAFLGSEADKLREQITTLEGQLATFKEKHSDNLPEFIALNRELLSRAEQRLRDNAQSIRTLEDQRVYLESELAQLSPTLGLAGSGGSSGSGPGARLQELETQYVGIAARYSPDHPDRIQMEREIAGLREELGQSGIAAIESRLAQLKGQLASLLQRYSESHPDVAALRRSIKGTEVELAAAKRSGRATGQEGSVQAVNPVYAQLRAKLDAARLEIEALKNSRVEIEQELALIESRLAESPRVEQDYKSIMRDYENAMTKYKDVRDKQMQAELAKSLEADRKGERFSLIEPPLVPDTPDKPNRPGILMLGLVLSVASGVGNLAIREILDKGLRGARAIIAVTGAPPLAIIPNIETQADRRKRARRFWIWIAGIVLTLTIGALLIHVFLIPLDILWFTVLRRIEVLTAALSQFLP